MHKLLLQKSKYTYKKNSHIFVVCFFVCILFVPGLAQAQADWRIASFDADITLDSERRMIVTEKITVEYLVDQEKRGIFRIIPTVYRDAYGNRYDTSFELLEVLQNGEDAMYTTFGYDEVEIKIGNPEVYLDAGEYVYSIRYSVEDVVLFAETVDEVYWNVTGVDWEVPIESSSVVLRLPEGASVTETVCYTGVYGSTEQCDISSEGDIVSATASDFMTIGVVLEKGAIRELTQEEKLLRLFAANWGGLLPIPFFFFVYFYWRKHGKDPDMAAIIPEYEPPNNLWAAQVGVLSGQTARKHIIAGMIVQLAVEGYLTLEVVEKKRGGLKDVIFTKVANKDGLDGSLDEYHEELYRAIFRRGDSVNMSSLKEDSKLSEALSVVSKIRKEFNKEQGHLVKGSSRRKITMIIIGLFICAGAIVPGLAFGFFTAIMFMFLGIQTVVLGALMQKPTELGLEMERRAKGFQMYMHTAERYRSQWQEKEGIFEKYLPYAIVFEDTEHWAGVFKEFRPQEIAVAPVWYSGPSAFNFDQFGSSLAGLNSVISKNMTLPTAPSSGSVSSGGGFSGGGFGGGGGRSW